MALNRMVGMAVEQARIVETSKCMGAHEGSRQQKLILEIFDGIQRFSPAGLALNRMAGSGEGRNPLPVEGSPSAPERIPGEPFAGAAAAPIELACEVGVAAFERGAGA